MMIDCKQLGDGWNTDALKMDLCDWTAVLLRY